MHYARWRIYGRTDLLPRPSPEERFWNQVDTNDPDGCWLWGGALDAYGYGQFKVRAIKAQNLKAHRYAYELLVGVIPTGMVLDHLCKVRCCVNPAHLEPVTSAENVRRNSKKTHCINGHPYTDDNVIRSKSKGRTCRTCRQLRKQRGGG